MYDTKKHLFDQHQVEYRELLNQYETQFWVVSVWQLLDFKSTLNVSLTQFPVLWGMGAYAPNEAYKIFPISEL